jgi:hypothetical protein
MPRKAAPCKTPGCEVPHLPGALFCGEHLSDYRQCSETVRVTDPETGEVTSERRCMRPASKGLSVCDAHGGRAPRLKAISARTDALSAMQRFVQPYEGDINPITAFEMEFRRTYGRILWLEAQIGAFEDEKMLIWGLTKQDSITASEFPGTNKTYEARIHVYEDMLRWERTHFLKLTQLWIKANLKEQELTMMRGHIEYTFKKVMDITRALGHDPTDPATHAILEAAFSRPGDTSMVPAVTQVD